MNISQIDDINKLKAIAYDLLREREQIQMDLEQLTVRIQQVEQTMSQNSKG